MTREEAKALLPIIQAYSEGKVIEYFNNVEWVELNDPTFYSNSKYRIKLEPKYRPFKNAEECWEEMRKHAPFGWIKLDSTYIKIRSLNDEGVFCGTIKQIYSFNELFYRSRFTDEIPFGIKKE